MTVFAKENLLHALTAAIVAGNGDHTDVEVASKLTDVLAALAELIRPPVVSFEAVAGELVADETPGLILAELRKITTLLEVNAVQGERVLRAIAASGGGPIRTATTSATAASASGLPG